MMHRRSFRRVGIAIGAAFAIAQGASAQSGPAPGVGEAAPSISLQSWLNAAADESPSLDKEPDDFDLQAWATNAGGAAPAGAPVKADPGPLLDRCIGAWKSPDAAAKAKALDALAAAAPKSFDLAAWAVRRFGVEFPITAKELKDLLAAQSHETVVDALIDRNPPADVLSAAAKDKALRAYSVKKAEEARLFAKKAIMVENWVLPGRMAKNDEEFWAELSINGIMPSPDQKSVLGVQVGSTTLKKANVGSFTRRQLARAYVMESLAAGKEPKLGGLEAAVTKERAATLKTLESRYPVEKR